MKRLFSLLVFGLVLPVPVFAADNFHETRYVIRLYNPATSEHLYTTDQIEAAVLHQNGWTQEFQSWWCTIDFGTPVYRVYSPVLNEHLYTSDLNEVHTLSQNGWSVDNGESPVFYSLGKLPIYRLYNQATDRHLLSISLDEYNALPAQGWTQEGTAFSGIDIAPMNPLLLDLSRINVCPFDPFVNDEGIDVNTLQ